MTDSNEPLRDEAVFVNRVASALSALGYQVRSETLVDGTRFDLLCDIRTPAIGTVRLAVECKSRTRQNVSRQEVAKFLHDLTASGSAIDRGLVVTSTGFTAAAYAVADESKKVQLRTIDEIHRELLDPTAGLLVFKEVYEKSRDYQHFVKIEAIVSATAGDPHLVDALAYLKDLASSSSPALAVVFADFGAGKTTLLRRLHYELATSFLNARGGDGSIVPLFIPLREYGQLPSVDLLVLKALREQLGREVPLEVFWRHLADARFALLLDGFDEMSGRADREQRHRLLQDLGRLITGAHLTVLSCRPAYFVQPHEYDEWLAAQEQYQLDVQRSAEARSPAVAGLPLQAQTLRTFLRARHVEPGSSFLRPTFGATLDLQPLAEEQILEFIERFGTDILAKQKLTSHGVYTYLRQIYDLRDLITRPILLEMALETIEHGAIDMNRQLVDIGPSQLYEEYMGLKLEWDWSKGTTRQALLSPDERRELATRIAFLMLESDLSEISLRDLIDLIPPACKAVPSFGEKASRASVEELATDIATCTFITRATADGLRFTHRSFAEFLIARKLVRQMLYPGSEAPVLPTGRPGLPLVHTDAFDLGSVQYAAGVLYFVGGFAMFNSEVRRLLRKTAEFLGDGTAQANTHRANAVGAVLGAGPHLPNATLIGTTVVNLRLRGKKISGGRWERLVISDSEIEECYFDQCRWDDVVINGCSVREVGFHGTVGMTVAVVNSEINGLSSTAQSDVVLIRSVASGLKWEHAQLSLRITDSSSVCDSEFSYVGGSVEVDAATCSDLTVTDARLGITGSGAMASEWSGGACRQSVLILRGRLTFREVRFEQCLIVIAEGSEVRFESCVIDKGAIVVEAYGGVPAKVRFAGTRLLGSALVGISFADSPKATDAHESSAVVTVGSSTQLVDVGGNRWPSIDSEWFGRWLTDNAVHWRERGGRLLAPDAEGCSAPIRLVEESARELERRVSLVQQILVPGRKPFKLRVGDVPLAITTAGDRRVPPQRRVMILDVLVRSVPYGGGVDDRVLVAGRALLTETETTVVLSALRLLQKLIVAGVADSRALAAAASHASPEVRTELLQALVAINDAAMYHALSLLKVSSDLPMDSIARHVTKHSADLKGTQLLSVLSIVERWLVSDISDEARISLGRAEERLVALLGR